LLFALRQRLHSFSIKRSEILNVAKTEEQQYTRKLCSYLAAVRFEDLPKGAVQQARRGVLDWLGCAIAGSTHPTVDKLIKLLQDVGGRPEATAIARRLKLGLLDAPFANGVMAHVLDYDDTYMTGTVLHASAPTLAAILALAERERCDGKQLLLSYVVGFEAAVRVAQAARDHHKSGWHATGILGTIAAGVAAGKLLELEADQLTYAVGIAATQAAGLLENRDSACKSLHAGKAASNGVLSALLASRAIDSSDTSLEGKQGFCHTFGKEPRLELLTHSLGTEWAIVANGFKPFACAIGLHPVIEVMMALRSSATIRPRQVQQVELRVSSYLSRYRSVGEPMNGHHSKFSAYHAAAVTLIEGAAGVAQFSDERVVDPIVVELSQRVRVIFDESLDADQAHASVLCGGRRSEAFIDRATGTARNPMSDGAIHAKFMDNAEPIIGSGRSRRVSHAVWAFETQDDLCDLIALCA
jgi:2-methylcitrate dehydratase PrpD